MITTLLHLLRLFPFLCSGHRQLALENLALRHQLTVYKRTMNRPTLRRSDRLFWVALSRMWAGWGQALIIAAQTPCSVGIDAAFANTGQALRAAHPGPPARQHRDHRPRQKNGRRESPVGRAQNPWRAPETRDRRSRAHRLQADLELTASALADVANIPRQPRPRSRLYRFLHGADR